MINLAVVYRLFINYFSENEGGSLFSMLEKLVGHGNITHASQIDLLNCLLRVCKLVIPFCLYHTINRVNLI